MPVEGKDDTGTQLWGEVHIQQGKDNARPERGLKELWSRGHEKC